MLALSTTITVDTGSWLTLAFHWAEQFFPLFAVGLAVLIVLAAGYFTLQAIRQRARSEFR